MAARKQRGREMKQGIQREREDRKLQERARKKKHHPRVLHKDLLPPNFDPTTTDFTSPYCPGTYGGVKSLLKSEPPGFSYLPKTTSDHCSTGEQALNT